MWSYNDLLTALNAANTIEDYIDGLTGGRGRAWMRTYLGGIHIWIGATNGGLGLPNNIILPSWWGRPIDGDESILAHELGHIWDINTGTIKNPKVGVEGGVADMLNSFIGGGISTTRDCRYCNPNQLDYLDPHIPKSETWSLGGKYYGNGATADYLAEAFAYAIYDRPLVPQRALLWVDLIISLEGMGLPQ